MANTASSNLKTITQRNSKALAVQATPHCETVGEKRVLGFIKGVDVPGVWIVRRETGRSQSGAPRSACVPAGLSCIVRMRPTQTPP
jgi:hypothetical protein